MIEKLKTVPKVYLLAGVLVLVAIIFAAGFTVATWRNASKLAAADKREQKARAEIDANNAENNKLRGINEEIRKEIAELTAKDEAVAQMIKENGGQIAVETKKLEQVNEELKNDQAIIAAPADQCVRCRRYSAALIARRYIDRPLACTAECSGSN